jgi:hypothetical protein
MPVKQLNVAVENPSARRWRHRPGAEEEQAPPPGLSIIAAYPAWRERGCPMGYSL